MQAEEGAPQLALTGEEDEDLESQMDAALRGKELQVYAQVGVLACLAHVHHRLSRHESLLDQVTTRWKLTRKQRRRWCRPQ